MDGTEHSGIMAGDRRTSQCKTEIVLWKKVQERAAWTKPFLCVDIGKEKVDIEKVRSASPLFLFLPPRTVYRSQERWEKRMGWEERDRTAKYSCRRCNGERDRTLLFLCAKDSPGFIAVQRKPRLGLPFVVLGRGGQASPVQYKFQSMHPGGCNYVNILFPVFNIHVE